MSPLSRRQLLGGTIIAAGSFTAGRIIPPFAPTPASNENPWQYTPIDAMEAAKLAYDIYPNGYCMYATFRAVVESVAMAQKKTNPAAALKMLDFPFDMMKVGAAGVASVGSLCGAVAGSSQAIALYVPDTEVNNPMVHELFQYYENSSLPSYKPEKDEFPNMASVKPGSPLCHFSITAWCKESGGVINSPIRFDRCRRLSADMVIKTITLLNQYHKNPNDKFAPLMEPTKGCVDCHSMNGPAKETIVKMNCASCHDVPSEHPVKVK